MHKHLITATLVAAAALASSFGSVTAVQAQSLPAYYP